MAFTTPRKQDALLGILLALLIALGAYASWYSYERYEKLTEVRACGDQLAHPPFTMMRAPDGSMAPVYSIITCTAIVVPPSLWDILRGRMAFEYVPNRMKVNPYSLRDMLLGRYTLGADVGSPCDSRATTTGCSSLRD